MTRPTPSITERQALEALWPWGNPLGVSPVVALARTCDVPEKVALRKIEKMTHRGYAEYGVSPWYSWRTPRGEERLRKLKDEAA